MIYTRQAPPSGFRHLNPAAPIPVYSPSRRSPWLAVKAEEVSNQSLAHGRTTDKLSRDVESEVRQAFANFVTDSKPQTVDVTGLKQFGYELFAGSPTTFAPVTDVPVPADYVIGPGDELKVQLLGAKSDQYSLVVDRNGNVSFPEIGPISLAGLSFDQARAELTHAVKTKMIGVTASITMGNLRSIRVFVLGEVDRPGSYVVSGLATLSNALMASGGIKKTGSLRTVELKRAGKLISTIDLYDFLLKGDTRKDARLLPGDVVFVPPIGLTAGIAGQVLRPAYYELKPDQATAGDLLNLAGGLLPKAYIQKSLLERINQAGEKTVLSFPIDKDSLNTSLKNGDVFKVFSALDFEDNPVTLIGNVKRPGKYAWKEGLHLSGLIPSDQALLPETFMDYGVIERETAETREPELVRFNLAALLENRGNKVDPVLQPWDKVYVFNRSHFRVVPQARVEGSVKSPGTYEIKKNMHLIDLVMAAGGLARDAYLDEAELYRTDPRTKEVEIKRYSLKSALTNVADSNPSLQDMDRVVVHSIWEKQRKYEVSIEGEIKNPGSYVYADNMHVSDLIFAAGNLSDRAYLKKAELTRYSIVNGDMRLSEHMDVDLEKALAGDLKNNLTLQPHDHLYVRVLSNWRTIEHVTIRGEVRFPGEYPINTGETLSSVIERAGGFSEDAYLPAAVFTRESIRKDQKQKLDDSIKQIEDEITRLQANAGSEPPRVSRRLFGLSHAASAA